VKRRRIAVALALPLAATAVALVAGWAVLVLSPRDYRLAWMLARTKRIEVSSVFARSIALEIAKPDEVARIVSTVTSKLDRRGTRPRRAAPYQARFILENGSEIALGYWPGATGENEQRIVAIRVPGRPTVEEYDVGENVTRFLAVDVWLEESRKWSDLGKVRLGDRDVGIELDTVDSGGGASFGEFPDSTGYRIVPGDSRPAALVIRLITNRGIATCVEKPPWIFQVATDDDPARIEVSAGSETRSLEIPMFRHHAPIVPPCPSCGAFETVLPIVESDWLVFGYAGKCKREQGWKKGDPELWCEHCRKAF